MLEISRRVIPKMVQIFVCTCLEENKAMHVLGNKLVGNTRVGKKMRRGIVLLVSLFTRSIQDVLHTMVIKTTTDTHIVCGLQIFS